MLKNRDDLSCDQFARKCGAPGHTTVRQWLNGKSAPGADYLRKIALSFGISADWLLGVSGPWESSALPDVAPELAFEVGKHIGRAVASELQSDWPTLSPESLEVDSARIVQQATLSAVTDARKSFGLLKRNFSAGRERVSQPALRALELLLGRAARSAAKSERMLFAQVVYQLRVGEPDLAVTFKHASVRPHPSAYRDIIAPLGDSTADAVAQELAEQYRLAAWEEVKGPIRATDDSAALVRELIAQLNTAASTVPISSALAPLLRSSQPSAPLAVPMLTLARRDKEKAIARALTKKPRRKSR